MEQQLSQIGIVNKESKALISPLFDHSEYGKVHLRKWFEKTWYWPTYYEKREKLTTRQFDQFIKDYLEKFEIHFITSEFLEPVKI